MFDIPYIYVSNNPNYNSLSRLLITKSLGDYNFKDINNTIKTKKLIGKYNCRYMILVKNGNNTYNISINFDDNIENVLDKNRINDNNNHIKNTLLPHIAYDERELFYNDYAEYAIIVVLFDFNY